MLVPPVSTVKNIHRIRQSDTKMIVLIRSFGFCNTYVIIAQK